MKYCFGGHPNGVKFGCLGHPNAVKVQSSKGHCPSANFRHGKKTLIILLDGGNSRFILAITTLKIGLMLAHFGDFNDCARTC